MRPNISRRTRPRILTCAPHSRGETGCGVLCGESAGSCCTGYRRVHFTPGDRCSCACLGRSWVPSVTCTPSRRSGRHGTWCARIKCLWATMRKSIIQLRCTSARTRLFRKGLICAGPRTIAMTRPFLCWPSQPRSARMHGYAPGPLCRRESMQEKAQCWAWGRWRRAIWNPGLSMPECRQRKSGNEDTLHL